MLNKSFDKHNHHSDKCNPAGEKKRNLTLLRITSGLNFTNIFYFASFCLQVVLGLTAVYLSITGRITPVMASVLMSVLGSVTSILGFFCIYNILQNTSARDGLVKEAIYRMITFKN